MRSIWCWVLLAGCATSEPYGELASNDTAELPTLSFSADWGVTQSGPLVAGHQVRVHYDLDRLPRCRAVYHGLPAWDILAYWSGDGGPASDVAMTEQDGTARHGVDRIITVPTARELTMWFYASDEYGCIEWDSAYGRNYHFAIERADVVVDFRDDWTVTRTGTLGADRSIFVAYDLDRLPGCRQTYNGLATWDVQVDYRFDGGMIQTASVTQVLATGERVAAPVVLAAPIGAHAIEMWFESNDRTGCHAWDSDYGNNFSFALP